jgi:ribosome-associated toxin RatA of RatAB toxin-antitoxin module
MAIQRISTEAVIRGNVRKESAWRMLSDFSAFPGLIGSVDKVTIIDRNEDVGKSEWFITLENAPLRWTQMDRFDIKNFEIRFESIDGDFETISGFWKVEDFNNEGIKLRYSVDYSLGIPVIEEVLGDILKEKMKGNIDLMINAIKRHLDKPKAEDRRHERFPVKVCAHMSINASEVRANVDNFSQGGMKFSVGNPLAMNEAFLSIDGVQVGAELHFSGPHRTIARAIFRQTLSDVQFERAMRFLMTENMRSQDYKITGPEENDRLSAEEDLKLTEVTYQ